MRLSVSKGFRLFSDDFAFRQLAKNEFNHDGINIEVILFKLKEVGELSDEEYHRHRLMLFRFNYRCLYIDSEIILKSLSESKYIIDEPFSSICRALKHGHYEICSLISLIADSLVKIHEIILSPTVRVAASMELLNAIQGKHSQGVLGEGIIKAIETRSTLIIPSDDQIIQLVKVWQTSNKFLI